MKNKWFCSVLILSLLYPHAALALPASIDVTDSDYLQFKSSLLDELEHYYDQDELLEEDNNVLFNSSFLDFFFPEYNESAHVEDSSVCSEEAVSCTEISSEACCPAASSVCPPAFNTEEYTGVEENVFTSTLTDPLSTFAADVDTGSYCNFRRMVQSGASLDSFASASRTEEFLNYFDYIIEETDADFSIRTETGLCPWNESHELLLMTLQANHSVSESAGNNFVFLIDSSGSMDSPEKLGLVRCSFKLMSYFLTEEDTVSIVTYSGSSETILDSCPGNEYETIAAALDTIAPYGGTNGSGGITAAYELAEKNFIEGGNNRVIIASDGDMNLGITSTGGLEELITEEKESGVYLTVLGYGSGNYSDSNMEVLADAGNGNYYYVDSLDEAQHVLIEKLYETTVTAATDVKFQVEFNPNRIASYRLIGYENRDVPDDAFTDPETDGGEVGADQQITILYETVPAAPLSDPAFSETALRYQGERPLTEAAFSSELASVKIRYDHNKQLDFSVLSSSSEMSEDLHLAVSLAEFNMLLHKSRFLGNASMESVLIHAEKALNGDPYREGYLDLVKTCMASYSWEN